jgi:hypothetical protein
MSNVRKHSTRSDEAHRIRQSAPATTDNGPTTLSADVSLQSPPYPGYGPKATIPEEGFSPSPERIIRESRVVRESRSRRASKRREQHASTKKDAERIPVEQYAEEAELINMEEKPVTHVQIMSSEPSPSLFHREDKGTSPLTSLLSSTIIRPNVNTAPTSRINTPRESIDIPSSERASSMYTSDTGTTSLNAPDRSQTPHVRDHTSTESPQTSTSSEDSDLDGLMSELWAIDPRPSIRVPKSTEQSAVRYRDSVQSTLEAELWSSQDEFMTLLVIISNGEAETPVIMIQLTELSDSVIASLKRIATLVDQEKSFVWLAIKGHLEFTSGETSGKYLERIQSGVQIEVEGGECGTAGLFLRNTIDDTTTVTGITAGHVVDKGNNGRAIYQPTIKSFQKQHKILRERLNQLKSMPVRKDPASKEIRKQEISVLEEEYQSLDSIKGTDLAHTKSNLKVGRTIKAEFKAVNYEGRHCVSDWGLFDVESRGPTEKPWADYPDLEGYLQTLNWEAISGDVGPLLYDLYVRKTGGSTGLKFGFVAGIEASFKTKKIKAKKSMREFYCLQEEKESSNGFAKKGDSGSAVITNEGVVVGFVYAWTAIDDVMLIMDHETGTLDIREFAKRRRSDGFVDIDDVYARTFDGTQFVLVESAEMIMQRSGVQGEIVVDC